MTKWIKWTKWTRWTRSTTRAATGLALAAFLLTAGGCLITSRSSVDEGGSRIGTATLAQIEPGVTTESWVLGALGEPTSRRCVSEDPRVEILEYTAYSTRKSSGSVFLLFRGSSHKHEEHTTWVEVTDGVVTRVWDD